MSLPRYVQWATGSSSGTYPALPTEPWSATATRVFPVYRFFTPGLNNAPTGQELNALIGAGMDSLGVGIASALNEWHAPFDQTTLVAGSNWVPTTLCWDAAALTWNSHIFNASTPAGALVSSLNNGRTWQSNVTVNSAVVCLACNAGLYVFWESGNDSVFATSGGAPSSTAVADTTNRNTATAWYSTAESLYYLYVLQDTGTTYINGSLITTPNGTTLTQHTVPSTWITATDHFGRLEHAQGPTFTLVAICGATPGTDTARLGKVSSGALTDVTPAVLSGKIIVGLGYDDQNGFWLLMAYDGSNTTLYASSDASTWSLVNTFAAARQGFGIRALGGVWAATMNSISLGAAYQTVLLSNDLGITWRTTFATPQHLSGTTAQMKSSGNSLLWCADNVVQTSYAAGFTGP